MPKSYECAAGQDMQFLLPLGREANVEAKLAVDVALVAPELILY